MTPPRGVGRASVASVTLLVRLDQPLKAKRPDWAQQPCQIPCSFERRLLADLAIFPMDHTMVASR